MWICRHRALAALVLFALAALSTEAATLNSIRFGTHEQFDRVVCDLSSETTYEIRMLPSGVLELYLKNTDVSEKFFLPKLPANVKVLTLVEAFRENERDVVIEIRGKAALTAKEIVLQGQSWRLALDISSDETETSPAQKVVPKQTEEPRPYIPGDKPIETKFAQEDKKSDTPSEHLPVEEHKQLAQSPKAEKPKVEQRKESVTPKHESMPLESEKPIPARTESDDEQLLARLKAPLSIDEPADTLKALDVLAIFYEVMGDTESAAQFEGLLTEKEQAKSSARRVAPQVMRTSSEPRFPDWLLIVLAIVGGLAGGVLGTRLAQSGKNMKLSFKMPKLPTFKKKKSETKEVSEPEAKELKRHSDELDKAVQREKKSVKKEVPDDVVKEAESAFPADEPAAEVMMKESLMDRRVKRVLELSAQKRNIADIAKELDMGQDEVKLILDLNS
jgi:chemotaxis protein histidine kinase CheA